MINPPIVLPWREIRDLNRIEPRREPAIGGRHAATRWKQKAGEGAERE